MFDLGFQDFVTPRIIQILFTAGIILYGLVSLGYLIFALTMSRYMSGATVLLLLVGIGLGFVVAVVLLRISLEVLIVVFRIAADLRAIRRLEDQRALRETPAPPAGGQPAP